MLYAPFSKIKGGQNPPLNPLKRSYLNFNFITGVNISQSSWCDKINSDSNGLRVEAIYFKKICGARLSK